MYKMYIKVSVDACGTGGTGMSGGLCSQSSETSEPLLNHSTKLTLIHLCALTNQINGKTVTKPQKEKMQQGEIKVFIQSISSHHVHSMYVCDN